MVWNGMVEKDSGLWIMMTRIAHLYCDYSGGILQELDEFGRGFHMIVATGVVWVKWEQTIHFLAALKEPERRANKIEFLWRRQND